MKSLSKGFAAAVLSVLWIAPTFAGEPSSSSLRSLRLDMGADNAGPDAVEPSFALVGRNLPYDDSRGFGWVKPPVGTFDYPEAYPPSALERDGVVTAPEGAVLGIRLQPGRYRVTVLLGVLPPFEWRPGMYVKVGEAYKVRGVMAGGSITAASFEMESRGEKQDLTFGAEYGGLPRACSLAGLTIQPSGEYSPTPIKLKDLPKAVNWLNTEGVRGTYGEPVVPAFDPATGRTRNGTRQFQRGLENTGTNAYFCGFQRDDSGLIAWSQWARAKKLHLFDICKFANGPEYNDLQSQFRKAVYSDGRVDVTPCPLDERAWRLLLDTQAIDSIRTAKANGGQLDGLLVDTEMYGAKVAEIYNNQACYCEDCIRAFRATGAEISERSGKAAYVELDQKGLLPQYLRFQEDRLTAILQTSAATIRREDPNFILGFLQWKPQNWFLRALSRGLGNATVPTLVCGEDTYYGYNDDADSMRRLFQGMGANALYVPGLWYNQFSPDGLRDTIRETRADAGHYWLYGQTHIHEVQNVDDKPAAGRSLPHGYLSRPAEEYWAAIREGNFGTKAPVAVNEPANREPRSWLARNNPPAPVDVHPTKLVPLTRPAHPVWLFDMGTADSPVAEGFTPVLFNTLYSPDKHFGWARRVTGSYDREKAEPLDPLTRDGLLVGTDNTFRADVANGRYSVTIVLGDMSPTEARPFQNVIVNGEHLVVDKLSNGGEYRAFTFPIEVSNGRIEFLCQGISTERTAVMGIMIGKETD